MSLGGQYRMWWFVIETEYFNAMRKSSITHYMTNSMSASRVGLKYLADSHSSNYPVYETS